MSQTYISYVCKHDTLACTEQVTDASNIFQFRERDNIASLQPLSRFCRTFFACSACLDVREIIPNERSANIFICQLFLVYCVCLCIARCRCSFKCIYICHVWQQWFRCMERFSLSVEMKQRSMCPCALCSCRLHADATNIWPCCLLLHHLFGGGNGGLLSGKIVLWKTKRGWHRCDKNRRAKCSIKTQQRDEKKNEI